MINRVVAGVVDVGRYDVVYVVYYEAFVVVAVDYDFAPSAEVVCMLVGDAVC